MTKTAVEDELMYGTANVNDHMTSAMTKEQASAWFGAPAPDLSLVTRVRGSNWVYSYLLAFHQDDTATGWNNHVFPQVSMPNVLYNMTAGAPAYYDAVPAPHGDEHGHVEYPEVPEKLDTKVQNLVSFLTYVGDPSVLARQNMGPWVLLFLVVLGVLTFLVKKEYWRDIH
jgi:ubiquinol-cytochrome c reductase cytochrome c1 subunit